MKKLVLTAVLVVVTLLSASSAALAQVPQPAVPGFSMQVQGTDTQTGAQGIWISQFARDLESRVAQELGWRPSAPTTVLLYPDAASITNVVEAMRGTALSTDERNFVLSEPAYVIQVGQAPMGMQAVSNLMPGSWLMLVNVDTTPYPTTDAWQKGIEESMTRRYVQLMEQDLIGTGGPLWFRQGLADAVTFRIVPGTADESRMIEALTMAQSTNSLTPLASIQENGGWNQALAGPSQDVPRGVAYLAVKTLYDRLGGMAMANILKRTRGESLSSLIQSVGGMSIDQLNAQYQSSIPPL